MWSLLRMVKESLFKWSRSHDQNGRTPIYVKILYQNVLMNLNSDDFKLSLKHLSLQLYEGYINGPGHMTKMVATPIYDKILYQNVLMNQNSDDFEAWLEASLTAAVQSLYK